MMLHLFTFLCAQQLSAGVDENALIRRAFRLPGNWSLQDQPGYQKSTAEAQEERLTCGGSSPLALLLIRSVDWPNKVRLLGRVNASPATVAPFDSEELTLWSKDLYRLAGHRSSELTTTIVRSSTRMLTPDKDVPSIVVTLRPKYYGFVENDLDISTLEFSADGKQFYNAQFASNSIRFIPPLERRTPSEAARECAILRSVKEIGSSRFVIARESAEPEWCRDYGENSTEAILGTDRFRAFQGDPSAAVLCYRYVLWFTSGEPRADESYSFTKVRVEAFSGQITAFEQGFHEFRSGLGVTTTRKPRGAFRPISDSWAASRCSVSLAGTLAKPVIAHDWKRIVLRQGKVWALVEVSPSKRVLRELWMKEWKYQKLSRATVKALLAKPSR